MRVLSGGIIVVDFVWDDVNYWMDGQDGISTGVDGGWKEREGRGGKGSA